MSLLINHPRAFKKARDEIDQNVGLERLVKEEDLPYFKYIHNIVSETFRMFPPLPLILPHESSEDCKLGGYDVPRGTIILANAWAVHRDPQVWEEPDKFKPERFEGKEAEGNKLMQFGLGRRKCPGSGLGQKVVAFALSSLIQNFDFETANGQKADLEEGIGLAMPRANPLVVKCKPRPEMDKLLRAII